MVSASGHGRVIAVAQNVASLEMIVQTKLAKEKPELVTGFVRAIRWGIEYVKQNPKYEVAQIIVAKTGDSGYALLDSAERSLNVAK